MNRIKTLVSSITLAALGGLVVPVAWTGPAPPPPPTMEISVTPKAESEPVSSAAGDAKFMTFEIRLSNIQASDVGKTVKVTWGVSPGTATAADYDVPGGSKTLSHKIVAGDVTIPGNPTGFYVLGTPSIGITYDQLCEGAEDFTLTLSSPDQAVLTTTTAIGSITDTVVPVDFVIDDAAADEDAGTLDLLVRVQSAEQPVANSVTLDYAVSIGAGDTAEATEDVAAPASGTVTVSRQGQDYEGTISVPINTDVDADHEKFTVSLSTSACGQVVSDGTAVATINDLDAPVVVADCGNFNGHPYQGGSIFFEFFRYLTGRDLYRAHSGGTDFDGGEACAGDEGDLNLDEETYSTRDEANATNMDGAATPAKGRLSWDASVQQDQSNRDNTTSYVSPLDANNACGSIYTVNLLFGVTQSDPNTLDNEAESEMTNPEFCAVDSPEGQCTGYDLGDDNYQDLTAQLAGWMKDHELLPNVPGDQNVTSFFIVEQQQEGSQQIQDYAAAGKFGADGANKDSSEREAALYTWDAPGGSGGNDAGAAGVVGLLNAIDAAIGDIVSKSATFVSASVPVDVFNRASVRDELYIALFQVGRDTDPLNPEVLVDWPGNLKKLKLQQTVVNGKTTFSIVDSLGNRGVDPAEGRIDTNALTYWTDPAALPSTIPCFVAEGEEPATGKDGRAVCIGAAGQNIPGFLKTPGDSAQGDPGLANPTTDLPPNTVAERQGARNLLTQLPTDPGAPGNPGTLLPLNADATTVNALHDSDGVGDNHFDNPVSGVDATRALELLCYARGLTNCASGTAREWIFGDVLHSRPLPINYGDRLGCATQTGFNFNSNPDIRILTGTNDGYLHMFQNTLQSNCSQPVTQLGIENWAFMPLQLVSNLQQLKLGTEGAFAGKFNAKQLNIEGIATPYHPYGVDGEPTVYTDPGSDGKTIEYGDGDKAYVFFGLRRGGKGYYGLDISNPDSPSILWALNGTDATRSITATPGFEELGMTFSKPAKARVNFNGSVRNVLVFGGGYYGGYALDGPDVIRPGYDYDDGNGADGDEAPLLDPDGDGNSNIEGNAIYVVDMETGKLLWKAVDAESSVSTDGDTGDGTGGGVVFNGDSRLDHSIVAEVAMLDSDGDGIDDRAYVGDLGGNVWRVDLPPRPSSETDDWRDKWGVRLLASLGGSGADDRRFYHRADVVLSRDPTNNTQFDAVLIGSGDRENAKGTVVQDHFYMLKDNTLGPDAGVGGSEVIMDELANADCFLPNNDPLYPGDVNCVVGANEGWRLDLGNPGEKILAPSITVSNEVFFTSYLPEGELDAQGAQDQCAPFEGNGRLYAVGLLTGAPINPDWSVGNEDTLDSADRYQKLTSTGIPSELVPLGPGQFLKPDLTTEKTKGSSHWKTYWYEKGVDL